MQTSIISLYHPLSSNKKDFCSVLLNLIIKLRLVYLYIGKLVKIIKSIKIVLKKIDYIFILIFSNKKKKKCCDEILLNELQGI